jgi:hypothetical protein
VTLHVTDLPFPARFWEMAIEDPETGCWEWRGIRHRDGYGRFSCRTDEANGEMWQAHRLAWTLALGPVPTDTLDHLCRNRLCVNPAHLEPTTRGENVRRGNPGKWARRDSCPAGHAYDEANTWISKQGWRQCRTCSREKQARIRARRRAAA